MPKSPWENEKFAQKNISHIDEKFLAGTEQEVSFLKAVMGIEKGVSIIDLGCGTGRHSIELARQGCRVVGVDISEVLLEEAKKRAAELDVDVEFINGDLRSLDALFENEEKKFSGAICLCESGFGVLGGEEEDLYFLKSVYGLLKPEGKFILTTFNGIRRYLKYNEKDSVFNYSKGVVNWSAPAEEFGEELTEEMRIYTPSEVRMLFKLAGFSKIEIFGCSPGNFNHQKLNIDDIEMMVMGVNGDWKRGTKGGQRPFLSS
ncbi:methyltransferase domain-containing protein [candidate division WOR-3 bacterium]|nr:methyltransferase domain-containing protein [candidate division WOR-3 bacterium]